MSAKMLYFLVEESGEINLIYDDQDLGDSLNYDTTEAEVLRHLKENESLGKILYLKIDDTDNEPLLGECLNKFIDNTQDQKIIDYLKNMGEL